MKKLVLTGAAFSAALLAGQANALLFQAAPNNNTPDIVAMRAAGMAEARMAGASAPTPMIEKAFLNNCAANTAYKFENGTSSFAWVCDNAGLVAALPVGTYPYLMLQKRDSGGSITGVVAALPFTGVAYTTGQQFGRAPYLTDATLNAGVCPAAAPPLTKCTVGSATANLSASTTNFADVDAAKFLDALNGAVPGAGGLASASVATQAFGVQVNLKLYRAMQQAMVNAGVLPASCAPTAAAQDESEACMPSLTTEQLSSIFGAGRMVDWRNLRWGSTNGTTQRLTAAIPAGDSAPTNNSIHLCHRTTGSGTLATQYLQFHNAPCFSGAEPVISAASATVGTESGTAKVLHSNSAQGDVDNCLEGLNNGTDVGSFNPYSTGKIPAGAFRWAIGFSSADRNEGNTKPFRYIKIDNSAPTLKNIVAGRYKVWSELTRIGPDPVAGTPANDLALDILTNMRNADQLPTLNKTYTWGQSGFLGIASSSTFAPTNTNLINGLTNAAFDPARPVNPYSHAVAGSVNGSGTDHCRVPSLPGGNRAMPVFYPSY